MDVEMAKSQRPAESTGLRQRKPQAGEAANATDTMNLPPEAQASKQFSLLHLVIAAVVFYLLGRFYQTNTREP